MLYRLPGTSLSGFGIFYRKGQGTFPALEALDYTSGTALINTPPHLESTQHAHVR